MTFTVLKYRIPVPQLGSGTIVNMPKDSIPMTVTTQDNEPCLWVEAPFHKERATSSGPAIEALEPFELHVVPTGALVELPEGAEYLGTCHGVAGWMVFHIYWVPK